MPERKENEKMKLLQASVSGFFSGIFVCFQRDFFIFFLKKEGAMEFDRRSNLRGREPAGAHGPVIGRLSWAAGGQEPVQLCPLGSSWHVPGARRPGVNAVGRGMHRAPAGIRRALENYPRGSGGWKCGRKVRPSYKETQLAFLPRSSVRGPGEWPCSGTCDELARGCSGAAAPGPARRPGGGPGLLPSCSHRR